MNQVTKKELIVRIAEETGYTQKVVEEILKAEHKAIPTMLSEVKVADKDVKSTLQITGFGTYSLVYVPAREGKNPKNVNETIMIPASYRLKFSAGKGSKDIVNA